MDLISLYTGQKDLYMLATLYIFFGSDLYLAIADASQNTQPLVACVPVSWQGGNPRVNRR